MLTLVKFHLNPEEGEGGNKIISRTLLKTTVVDRRWRPEENQPEPGNSERFDQDGELWKVRLLKDTAPGRVAGCFICQPICKVNPDEVVHLVPGMYEDVNHKGLIILNPLREANWMLPLENKKYIASTTGAYAIIVRLGGRQTL